MAIVASVLGTLYRDEPEEAQMQQVFNILPELTRSARRRSNFRKRMSYYIQQQEYVNNYCYSSGNDNYEFNYYNDFQHSHLSRC